MVDIPSKTITEIKSLARAHTDSAIKVLSGIMNQPAAPEAARVAAANSLLDRGWGKPSQKHEGPGEKGEHIFRWAKDGEGE